MTQDRVPLNRERVIAAGIALADAAGFDAVSMRRLAHDLDVVPMALYKHVVNKEVLLDGMVDALIGEIGEGAAATDWRSAVRARVLAARAALLRHPWARQAIESRTNRSLAVLGYLDGVIGIFLDAGFSTDLTHHAMHTLGSRVWGLTQDVFEDQPGENAPPPEMLAELGRLFPHVLTMAMADDHDPASTVGPGCDDQFEFEFALDLLLDGFQRLHESGWTSAGARSTAGA